MPCPLCGHRDDHPVKLRVHQADAVVTDETSYSCEACGGFFAWPFTYPDYLLDYGMPDYLRYYLEIGAGIQTMLAPVVQAHACRSVATMIDVGCGVPFTVDFARRHYGIDAHAIDPSTYARKGAQILDASVDFSLLGAGSRFDGQTFDFVMSSEVIEHVPDPPAFLAVLARHTADDGLLLVTTPAAEWVSPERGISACMATIWPGIHHAIFSREGLGRELSRLGFTSIDVRQERERLYAWASRRPLGTDDRIDSPDPNDVAAHWRAYAADLAGRMNSDGRPLLLGNQFRLLRDAVNTGQHDQARAILSELRSEIRHFHGTDILETDSFRQQCAALPEAELFANWPYFAYLMPYYLGMMALLDDQFADAEREFRIFLDVMDSNRWSNCVFWTEGIGLYPWARYHLGLTRLLQGERESAARDFAAIILGDFESQSAAAMLAGSDLNLSINAQIQLGVCHLQSGAPQTAASHFTLALQRAEASGIESAFQDQIQALLDVAFDTAGS